MMFQSPLRLGYFRMGTELVWLKRGLGPIQLDDQPDIKRDAGGQHGEHDVQREIVRKGHWLSSQGRA
jgi:hypothetical protein